MFRQGMKFLLADLDEQLEFNDAASCEQAMVVLSSESIDLVLLDLNMPGSQVLIAALRLILAGGVYLPAMVLNAVSPSKAGVGEGAFSPLSGRQTAVLLKAIQGKTNKVLARDLQIAEGTVKTHLSAAYKVLAVSNRTEAVFVAAKLGLRPVEAQPV